MKINQNQYQRRNTGEKATSFKRYYDAEMMKEFEKLVKYYKKHNPRLQCEDIAVMRKSIDSFNAVYKGAQSVNTENVENQIYKKFKIPADFKGEKFIASMSALTLNIFKKLHLPLPTGIYVAPLNEHVAASCDTMDRFITFNQNGDWANSQYRAIIEKLANWSSTGHFLQTPIHEFMHSAHLANIHKIAAQKQQLVDSLHSKMLRDFLKMDFKTKMINEAGAALADPLANQKVAQKVSEYGSYTPAEMYADIGAKMITYNLDRKTILPTRNPFVFKDFTEDKYLMKMMNDIWSGNVKDYIK